WIVEEHCITYHLFVRLLPPPGHSFSLELGSLGQDPAKPDRVRVVAECICSRGQLLGENSCPLHQPESKLPNDKYLSFLSTLCIQSYLDFDKVIRFIRELVRSAWLFLPASRHCQLAILPSGQSCSFQLTTTSMMKMNIEMHFVMQD
ncbi:IPIL1 protein, partial [Turnix velox]|nr:IPIL1 protein [Turnix velox]